MKLQQLTQTALNPKRNNNLQDKSGKVDTRKGKWYRISDIVPCFEFR